jgi:multicomponent Na+:H+ antiporter subunit D
VLLRFGPPRASGLAGLAGTMPVTAFFVVLGGAAAAGAPGLGVYVSLAAALEAAAQWPTRLVWLGVAALSGVLFAALALRPALIVFRGEVQRAQLKESPFPMMLGMILAAFFCVAVGLSPTWLYRLTPSEGLTFAPYTPGRLGPQLELIGAAGAAYVLFRALRLAPRERALELLDCDALYRGPVAGAGRWTGVVILRIFGALQALWDRLAARAAGLFAAWARGCDRPYADRWSGAAQFAAIGAVLVIILWASH